MPSLQGLNLAEVPTELGVALPDLCWHERKCLLHHGRCDQRSLGERTTHSVSSHCARREHYSTPSHDALRRGSRIDRGSKEGSSISSNVCTTSCNNTTDNTITAAVSARSSRAASASALYTAVSALGMKLLRFVHRRLRAASGAMSEETQKKR